LKEKTSTVTNLGPAANYRVTVTDANGCTATATTAISEPTKLLFDDIRVDSVSCPRYSDGLINVIAKGGTVSNAKQYEYSIDGGVNFVSGSKFASLTAGDYNVVLRDNNGCVAARKVTVGSPEELFITAQLDKPGDTIKMGESMGLSFVPATQSGLIPWYVNIDWIPSVGLNCSDCASPKASPYVSTDFNVEVRYHKNCLAKSKVRLPVHAPLDFFVPSAFTPGTGTGINDVLYVYGNGIKKLKFVVVNRWGEKVFECDNISKGWDGMYKGELQSIGVYSFFAEVEYLNGDKKNKKGSVTLIR
jgi:gliding motility-associated-like protein